MERRTAARCEHGGWSLANALVRYATIAGISIYQSDGTHQPVNVADSAFSEVIQYRVLSVGVPGQVVWISSTGHHV